MKIIAVIPAYNEEENNAAVVGAVRPFVSEIAVVDDASSDRTSERALAAGAAVIRHVINRDQGAALETGSRYALEQGADIVLHIDADGQHRPEEIPDILRPIIEGRADIVFGSRFMGKRSDLPKLKRYVFFPVARLVNRLLLGVRMSDPQSGFRALSSAAMSAIRIENDGKAHCSEIMHKAAKSSFRVLEVPIRVIYSRFGLSFGGGIRIVKDLLIKKIIS